MGFAAILFTGALSQPWVGWISDTFGRRPVLVIGNGLSALAASTLILEMPFLVMITMMAVAVAALDSIRAAMIATAVDHTDRSESTTLGLAFALMDGVGASGAVLAGIAANISWNAMFGLAAVFAFGAAVLSVGGRGTLAENRTLARVDLLLTWRERGRRRKDHKERLETNPHLIDDIGMNAEATEAEITKRFWQK